MRYDPLLQSLLLHLMSGAQVDTKMKLKEARADRVNRRQILYFQPGFNKWNMWAIDDQASWILVVC